MALLLAMIDTGAGAAEAIVLAVAYFDKHQGFVIQRDAVDFAAAHPVVTCQDA